VLVSGSIVLTDDDDQERSPPVEEWAQDPVLYGDRARVEDRGDSETASGMPALRLGFDVQPQLVSPDAPGPSNSRRHTMLVLRTCRWRCRRPESRRLVFTERLPELVANYARRSHDLSLLMRLFGHQVGGRPSVRLLDRLGISLSGATVLRQAMHDAPAASSEHGTATCTT
jgi:hypothetical protein